MRFGGWKQAIFVIMLIVVLWPFKSNAAPEWEVWVTDQAGMPARNVVVREAYTNYSAEFHGHTEDQLSDKNGYVKFSAKAIRSPLVVRMIVAAMNVMGGAHASFGPHSFLFAFGNGVGSDGKSWDGDPPHMTSHLVLCSTLPCSSNTKTQ